MADKLYTVNLALAHLGEPSEVTLDPTLIRNATKKALVHAEQARDALLERHPWLCALAYTTLQPSALSPPVPVPPATQNEWNYANVFELPGDFIRLFIVPDAFPVSTPGLTYFNSTYLFPMASRWSLGSVDKGAVGGPAGVTVKVVFFDAAGPLQVSYVRRLDWSAMPPSMIDALALSIAARACRPINGSIDLATALSKEAAQALMIAQSIDGTQEGSQDPEILDTFNLLRLSAR